MRVTLGVALATTLSMAAVAGTASADLRPPAVDDAVAAKSRATNAAPAPAVPTFVNGLAQPVFSATTTDWVNYDLWVQSNFDSDRDGKLDRIHVDVSRPKETDTEGLKVPVVFEDSPYYAGGADSPNFSVEHELGQPPAARIRAPYAAPANTSPRISTSWENYFVPRGYAVVHAESPGSGLSDGCTTSGGRNETLGATTVIDWLNGRAKGYTTKDGMEETSATSWSTGKVGMAGTSYNGTIPIAAATTGVAGLDAIIPIEAISDWYDYYRANGLVRAPHSATGGQNGNNSYLGEDLDVLAEYTYSRKDDTNPRSVCWPVIDEITANEDRVSGNRSAFWDERNYMKDANRIKAATLVVHGTTDFNVMSKNAAQLWKVLKANNVPRQFFFHQGGHTNALPNDMANRWFSKYLYGQDNGVQNQKSFVVRSEANACPARTATVPAQVVNSATLTVSDASPFQVGNTLTIPRSNPTGAPTNDTRVITAISGSSLTLASAVATGTGQFVAAGATVSLVCGTTNPTQYADWPDPATADVTLKVQPGGAARGGLSVVRGAATGKETLTDNATIAGSTLMNAATSPNRLVYQTEALSQAIRISGSPRVSLDVAFSKPRANFSAALISYPATGNGTIVTRGWMDPENRNSDYVSDPVVPGTTYRLNLEMQATDTVIAPGRRLALMVFSSDREYTIRPAAGTELTLDLAGSTLTIPVVGGPSMLASAIAEGVTQVPSTPAGTVPATLALTLGAPASFGPFVPGLAKEYSASTTATVISTAGDATLTVSDPSTNSPGRLVNGVFSLPQPLQGLGTVKTWSAPTSNESVPVAFKQAIGAGDALRTGTYSKTLTFTLSTTTP